MAEDKIGICLDLAEQNPKVKEGFDEQQQCPKCKVPPEVNFGLAGGGYGVYSYCPGCGTILTKSQIDDE